MTIYVTDTVMGTTYVYENGSWSPTSPQRYLSLSAAGYGAYITHPTPIPQAEAVSILKSLLDLRDRLDTARYKEHGHKSSGKLVYSPPIPSRMKCGDIDVEGYTYIKGSWYIDGLSSSKPHHDGIFSYSDGDITLTEEFLTSFLDMTVRIHNIITKTSYEVFANAN